MPLQTKEGFRLPDRQDQEKNLLVSDHNKNTKYTDQKPKKDIESNKREHQAT